MKKQIIESLQIRYNQNKSAALDGTPPVSEAFFQTWREGTFHEAFNYLVQREQSLGSPQLPATLKALMNLAGSAMLALGIEKSAQESDSKLLTYTSRLALPFTMAMLFLAQGSGPEEYGYGVRKNRDGTYTVQQGKGYMSREDVDHWFPEE